MTNEEVIQLIKSMVVPLVAKSELIDITVDDTDDFIVFNLKVDEDDIGRVIGRGGQTAKAIRTILYSVRLHDDRRLRLNIVD